MKTPKRKLTFQTVGETPLKTHSAKCVLVHYPAGKWVPALIEKRVPGGVRVLLFSESHTIVKPSDIKLFLLNKGTKLRVRDDERTYRVVGTSSSGETPWRLETGENVVSLHAGRSTRTLKQQVKNIFLYDASHLPSYVEPDTNVETPSKRRKPAARAASRAATRTASIYYESQSPSLRLRQVFDGCCFVVDDLVGQRAVSLAENGATLVEAAALSEHKFPKECKFFAVIGHSIAPTSPYLEALAIGWPCLSFAFIADAIAENSIANWKTHLLAVVHEGTVKSQDVALFEHQWASGCSLKQQFDSRVVLLAKITVPVYLCQTLHPLLQRLVALTRPQFEVCDAAKVPRGCLFISKATEHYDETIRQQICSQPRVENTVVLSADWLLKAILNQSI